MNATAQGISAFATAAELSRALADGNTSSTEIVRRALDRVDVHDNSLHAFVRLFPGAALQAAGEADERRSRGVSKGPLDGIPFAAKDLLDVEGYPTLAGSKALAGELATATATAIERLVAAGMILLGKVHTVEFAFGSWGTNPVAGTPLNPRDSAIPRAPGGSSSGSGVAVAAGLVPVALGTDTTGSIRNPSAMCGIVGLKTSFGLIGRGGLLPLAMSFDSIGPMTRSVEDAALLLAALEGPDPGDPATFGVAPTSPLDGLERSISGLRLRIPSAVDLAGVDPGILDRFDSTVAELEALGANVDRMPMPQSYDTYKALAGDIMAVEAWHHLGRYVEPADSGVGTAIRMRVLKGREIGLAAYHELIARRRAAQIEFHRDLEGADAFLTPTAPITAPPLADIDETTTPLGTFTRMVNLLDMAALSVPIGLVNGLPAGLQIAVRRFQDPLALRIGRALEIRRGGLFEQPPGYATP
ncbi:MULTISPECIES: amidase [unclassified Mesorhizobium]|uniref:amidase n=1 Tax=unclassified Mesorhizobium TaxID=325217 RepID=UPI00112CAF86|nr:MULTISPECIES: amidase [unclassified Mesorhizobium]MBZ9916832.1 amidase [Mesorhizobium sp. BR1-1-7]MBZ9954588.1 amidase [Mesorhizobium sp. BR1-1-15]MBZ9971447.1 amidase [Mesorhizobium sp. BR1-1-12]MCA0058582.1 amidase [Mesorhizobium sp. B261B1A]TPL17413.1 amidase [Mesorhizobium sp. B2-4-10]